MTIKVHLLQFGTRPEGYESSGLHTGDPAQAVLRHWRALLVISQITTAPCLELTWRLLLAWPTVEIDARNTEDCPCTCQIETVSL